MNSLKKKNIYNPVIFKQAKRTSEKENHKMYLHTSIDKTEDLYDVT